VTIRNHLIKIAAKNNAKADKKKISDAELLKRLIALKKAKEIEEGEEGIGLGLGRAVGVRRGLGPGRGIGIATGLCPTNPKGVRKYRMRRQNLS